MMDGKGPMNEPPCNTDDGYRPVHRHLPKFGKTGGPVGSGLRPPVLDDSHVQTVWAASSINWESVAEQRAQTIADQFATIAALRSDLSGARFERDIWWPLAFCVGVGFGMGAVWWMT